MPRRVNILGVNVDVLTIPQAIDTIIVATAEPRARYIVKPYVEFFDGKHEDLLNRAWLCLPDGVALQWAAHFQTTSGSPWQLIKTLAQIVVRPATTKRVLPARFGGINFTWPLLKACADHDRTVFLVGSPQGTTIAHTAETLQRQIPGLQLAGACPGRDEATGVFSHALEQQLLQQLATNKPDVVLIGIGRPRQELLMQRLIDKLDHGILIGEGGTFDYRQFGGKRPRAPKLVQTLGLEWLWRLIQEPIRIKRQLAIPRFIARVYTFTKTAQTAYDMSNKDKQKR